MPIEPLQTWKDELENLPKVADNSWALNFANWYASMIIGIEPDPAALTPTGWVFTFPAPVFAANLQSLAPTDSQLDGISGFADAWLAAAQISTIVVAPGTIVGPPPGTPPAIFSVVNPPPETQIDPSSVTAAKAKILELVTAPPAGSAQDSQFPEKFRDATLLLTISVSGLDSTPTPAGPLPLSVANVPLV